MEKLEIFQLRELFEKVQLNNVFSDSKTFPDCLPKYDLNDINEKYFQQKNSANFNLKKFVEENFELPQKNETSYKSNTDKPIKKHIENLWDILTRKPNSSSFGGGREKADSLIPLPFSYIVPGGRFQEIYYWDSYFTMLGLQVSQRIGLMQNMIDNFSYLIDKVGYIPNGNRSYYLGRSQPPFYSLMIKLLSEQNVRLPYGTGKDVIKNYMPQLEKEYNFWMNGIDFINEKNIALNHVVMLPDGYILNRYWDAKDTPRPEAYKEDIELVYQSKNNVKEIYENIRAAAESGWDFSSRWFKNISSFASIHTTEILPVDLNCLLFHLEQTLSEAHQLSNNISQSASYQLSAEKRKATVQKYCWSEELNFYFDYDFTQQKQKSSYTLAATFPLFFRIATDDQAKKVAEILEKKFLKFGGLVTTLETTGQQWDAPNGWAPLQWIAIKGLQNYGLNELAETVARRWIELNKNVYNRTGKLMEKYNVIDMNLEAGGGEYPSQDGFGWTNGVLLKLMEMYDGNK
ncbi:MAG: alpha,alpha-trehalase TreF [Chitinophagaceae bacterium]